MNKPDPIDIHVGKRLKQRRLLLAMSQEKLADAIGITFQQIQKYENGSNRVGASRLFQIGQVLEAPVSYFFDEYSATSKRDVMLAQVAEETPHLKSDLMSRKETLNLIRAYYSIKNTRVRKKMMEMLRSLGEDMEMDKKTGKLTRCFVPRFSK